LLLGLSACATGEGESRPGVLEAKACQKTKGGSLGALDKQFQDLVIDYCTSNGVWVVTRTDPQTRQQVEQYDFVNREYAGPETGFVSVQVETLTQERVSAFYGLQKQINQGLKEGM